MECRLSFECARACALRVTTFRPARGLLTSRCAPRRWALQPSDAVPHKMDICLSDFPVDILNYIFVTYLWEYFPVLKHVCSQWNDLCLNAPDCGVPVEYGPRTMRVIATDNHVGLLEWARHSFGLDRKPRLNIELLIAASSRGHSDMTFTLLSMLDAKPVTQVVRLRREKCGFSKRVTLSTSVDHVSVAMENAARFGHADVLKSISTKYERCIAEEEPVLCSAALGGHRQIVDDYIVNNTLVTDKVLRRAAQGGHVDLVCRLISRFLAGNAHRYSTLNRVMRGAAKCDTGMAVVCAILGYCSPDEHTRMLSVAFSMTARCGNVQLFRALHAEYGCTAEAAGHAIIDAAGEGRAYILQELRQIHPALFNREVARKCLDRALSMGEICVLQEVCSWSLTDAREIIRELGYRICPGVMRELCDRILQ